MASIVLGSTTVISESSGTPTIQSGVAFPAGCVIQCHHILTSTRTSYNAPVGTDGTRITELDLPITLKSSNSKIVCQWMMTHEVPHNSVIEIFKDNALATHGKNLNATNRYSGFWTVGLHSDADSTPHTSHIQYIDPNPTSATYNLRISSSNASAYTFYLNRSVGSAGNDSYENGVSTGVIWEIMK